ncbi:SAM-dependent methyltransferase [Sphingobacteriaceae bacterium]|nr:SAM-dependent methyltransferase [Sphingobacteriaceae bacterium]
MKDNFSLQSEQYLKFRPGYPSALVKFLTEIVRTRESAWDCGTGNGQLAFELSKNFKQVYASDISESQVKEASAKANIQYLVESAEKTSFADNSFDLITVAQAIHWFNFAAFYAEAQRTIKRGGVLAVIGYGLLKTGTETDAVISELYGKVLGGYWDKERKYIDENYKTIPFPFEELIAPEFPNEYEWTFDQLIGYLQTWSAVKHYEKQKNENPVLTMLPELQKAWGAEIVRKIKFPILLRLARIQK